MKHWAARFESLVGEVREKFGGAARAIRTAFDKDPFEILVYRGYGNRIRASVYGRALEVRNVSSSTDADSTLRNLLNTYAALKPIRFRSPF